MGAACVAHLGHTAQYLYPNNWAPARSLGSLITVYRHEGHPSLQTLFAVVGATGLACGIREIAADHLTQAKPRWHLPDCSGEKKSTKTPVSPSVNTSRTGAVSLATMQQPAAMASSKLQLSTKGTVR